MYFSQRTVNEEYIQKASKVVLLVNIGCDDSNAAFLRSIYEKRAIFSSYESLIVLFLNRGQNLPLALAVECYYGCTIQICATLMSI